jgi:hypothetical protein
MSFIPARPLFTRRRMAAGLAVKLEKAERRTGCPRR